MGKLKASIFLESGVVHGVSLQKESFNTLLDVGNYLFCSKSKQ